jgi:hypothetical protein
MFCLSNFLDSKYLVVWMTTFYNFVAMVTCTKYDLSKFHNFNLKYFSIGGYAWHRKNTSCKSSGGGS